MRRLALLAVVCAGCGDSWPGLDPHDTETALDPRLGLEIARSVHAFRIGSVFLEDGLQVIYEERSEAWHAVLIDPETEAITELPGPPLEPEEGITLGRAMAPMRGVIAVVRIPDVVVMVLDDGGWSELPGPPITAAEATVLGQLLAHHGNVYLQVGTTVLVWNGEAWTEPISTANTVLLGGFDADTQWLVSSDGAVPIAADGSAGAMVPATIGAPVASAINGDADRFQVMASTTLWTFDGATFTPGDAVAGGSPYSAPGSARVLLGGDGTPSTAWQFAEGGAVGEIAMSSFSPFIDCGCDAASDPTCGCLPHTVDFVAMRPSPDTATMALTMADGLDGYAVLTARFLPLPYPGDPFAP